MTIRARYPGRCVKCGGRINPGDQIHEVNLSSSVTGPRFVELGGVAAARALHAAIQGDMEYFESLFTGGLTI